MDELDRQLINALQNGLPGCQSPFKTIATALMLSEEDVLARLKRLLYSGILTRFGPLYNAEQLGGALTLAAVKAPTERFDNVVAIINAFPEVAHNYARDHALNIWFVLATETPEQLPIILDAIAEQTGLRVYNMPKIKEYFVNLKLEA